MCRLISMGWFCVLVWSVAALLFGVSARARAELIPIDVVETPTGLDWTISWQQDGAEELLLGAQSEDWGVRISVEKLSMEPMEWLVTADVSYAPLRPDGIRLPKSSGRVSGSFAVDSFGDVLDAQGTTIFGLFDPNAVDPCSLQDPITGEPVPCLPPMPDGGLLFLHVDERQDQQGAITSTIHVSADLSAVVPEPSSGQIALAAIACLLLLRVRRVGKYLRAMVKSTPVAGGRALRCVFATLAAITLQFAVALPDAAAGTLGYTFTTLEFPGAQSTIPYSINNAGVIVGTYSLGGTIHGFVFDEGAFTTIDFPNATGGTVAADINDQGQIVGGFYSEPGSPSQGFLFDGANYEVINFPGADATGLSGINNDGKIVGAHGEAARPFPENGKSTAFIFDGTSFETVAYPGAANTTVLGINNLGTVVGTYTEEPGPVLTHADGFLFDGVDYERFDIPRAGFTTLWDINDRGDIVGDFSIEDDGTDVERPVIGHALLHTLDGGFIVDLPKAFFNSIRGINNGRTIVGVSANRDGQIQAFVGTPVPEPSGLQITLAAIACLLLVRVPRVRLGCRAMVKSTPVAGRRAMRCVFATLAAVTLQFAMALPDAAADTLKYTFTTFEFPGADSTTLLGINNAGVLVGSYSLGGTGHGFVFDTGAFTTIDFPNAAGGTVAADINDQGQIVGTFFSEPASLVAQGFLFDGANYEVFGFPGAASTMLWGINNSGQIVGGYAEVVGPAPNNVTDTGFTFDGASFETVAYPGAGQTSVLGINNLGTMVGWSAEESGIFLSHADGFLFDGVDFELFDNPRAQSTNLWDINDRGEFVGDFFFGDDGTDVERPLAIIVHGLVRTLDGEFIVDVPDANLTSIYGINNGGTIVGTFVNSDGQSQAFVGTPVPEPSSLSLFLIGCLAACSRRVSRSYVRRRSGGR